MAQPITSKFGKFIVSMEDPTGSPGTFIAPCGFTDKSLALSADTNDQQIPDCDDPDAPYWTAREVKSLSAQISGTGLLALENWDEWRAVYLAAVSHNYRVELNELLANNGGYFSGKFIITALTLGATLGNKTTLNVTMNSDGALAWTPAAA